MIEKHLKKRSCCKRGYEVVRAVLKAVLKSMETVELRRDDQGVTSTALLRLQFLSLQLERSQAARRDPSLI